MTVLGNGPPTPLATLVTAARHKLGPGPLCLPRPEADPSHLPYNQGCDPHEPGAATSAREQRPSLRPVISRITHHSEVPVGSQMANSSVTDVTERRYQIQTIESMAP